MTALAVQLLLLVEVDSRTVDRIMNVEPVLDGVDDDLHHRAAQTQRAGASDHQARAAVRVDDDRRTHPR